MVKIISFLLIFFSKKLRFLPKFKNFQNFGRTKTGFLKIFVKKLTIFFAKIWHHAKNEKKWSKDTSNFVSVQFFGKIKTRKIRKIPQNSKLFVIDIF